METGFLYERYIVTIFRKGFVTSQVLTVGFGGLLLYGFVRIAKKMTVMFRPLN